MGAMGKMKMKMIGFDGPSHLDLTKYWKTYVRKIMSMGMKTNKGSSICYRLTFLRELPSIVSAFRFRVGGLTGRVPYVPSSDCYKYHFSAAAFTIESVTVPHAQWQSHPPRFRLAPQ